MIKKGLVNHNAGTTYLHNTPIEKTLIDYASNQIN